MRIAMIIQRFYPHVGGAERQLAAISQRMIRAGHDVKIFTRRFDTNLPLFEEIEGIPVQRIPVPGPKPMKSLSFSILTQSHIRSFRPDVIHAHELLSPSTTALLSKRLFNVPVVAKLVTGGVFGDIHKLQNRWSGPWRITKLKKQIDRFIVISEEINQELEAINVPESQRIFIPNGVDISRFSPVNQERKAELRRSLNLPQGQLALFTGRLTEQKRLDLLIKSWPWVRHLHPEANLLILGSGEEEARFKKMAGSGIHFLGRKNDVAPFLKAADLFVLPSGAEGLSNSMLEAMACGLPPLVTAVGAAPQIIKSGYNGWLIEPNNQSSLEANLDKALCQVDQLPKIGQLARNTVVDRFALDSVVSKLLTLYADLAASHHPSPLTQS